MSADEIRRLQQLIDAGKQKCLEFEQLIDAEKQQRLESDRRADAEKQQRLEWERRFDVEAAKTKPTNLPDVISLYHTVISESFHVQTQKSLMTTGGITSPAGKWCPTTIKPWVDCKEALHNVLRQLYSVFSADCELFDSRSDIAKTGKRVSQRPVGDEKTLEYILHLSVEDPVRDIISSLSNLKDKGIQDQFNLVDGVVFSNHLFVSGLVQETLEAEMNETASAAVAGTPSPTAAPTAATTTTTTATTAAATTTTTTATTAAATTAAVVNSPQRPPQAPKPGKLLPDQICVRRNDGPGQGSILYVCEYKPPHKLRAADFDRGLHPMDVYEDVVQRCEIPTAEAENDVFKSENLVASALTQTYHYMIGGGLEYGVLTTGEAIVFLKIDWDHPDTLHYHLSFPFRTPLNSPDSIDFQISTSVGQYLAFTLLCFQSKVQDHNRRHAAQKHLNTWQVDFSRIWTTQQSPPGTSSGSEYKSNVSTPQRSPHLLRRKRKYESCRDPDESRHRSESDDPPDTPTPDQRFADTSRRAASQGGEGRGSRRKGNDGSHSRPSGGATADNQRARYFQSQPQQYCSQKCLLGLVGGLSLDPLCPNVDLHRQGPLQPAPAPSPSHAPSPALSPASTSVLSPSRNTRHPFTCARFLELLGEQMAVTLDHGLTDLCLFGARGVAFKVSLLEYGYTFVGKASPRVFIKCLEHEAAMYAQLHVLQGECVPVFLGALDLRTIGRSYFYTFGLDLVYMTFLSWGGCALGHVDPAVADRARLEQMAGQTLRRIHHEGVVHRDVRVPNMLYNEETSTVMMIDFERSVLARAVAVPSPPGEKKGKDKKRSKTASMFKQQFEGDIRSLSLTFMEHHYMFS